MWAKWLHHPRHLGDPQRFARGQKSEKAMLPTGGQSGYITPAIWGVPNAVLGSATLSAGKKRRNGYVGHMWAKWLGHPYRLGGLQCLAGGQKSEIAMWPTWGQSGYITPTVLEVPNAQREDKNKKWLCGSQRGKVATSPLSSCGSPTLSAGSSPPSSGVPNARRWDKYWKWLRGPHVGQVATSPLPSWGSPTLSARTKIRNGYVAHMWAKWLHHPCYLGVPNGVLGSATLSAGTKRRNGYVGHMWAKCLHHPYHLGDSQRFARGQKSEMATWPTCGQSGYITPAVLGVPNA